MHAHCIILCQIYTFNIWNTTFGTWIVQRVSLNIFIILHTYLQIKNYCAHFIWLLLDYMTALIEYINLFVIDTTSMCVLGTYLYY